MNAHSSGIRVGGQCVPGVVGHFADAEPGFSCLWPTQNWMLWRRVRSQHLFPQGNLSVPTFLHSKQYHIISSNQMEVGTFTQHTLVPTHSPSTKGVSTSKAALCFFTC